MHEHRLCLVILTTFYHMCHLLYSATGDVVKVVCMNKKTSVASKSTLRFKSISGSLTRKGFSLITFNYSNSLDIAKISSTVIASQVQLHQIKAEWHF